MSLDSNYLNSNQSINSGPNFSVPVTNNEDNSSGDFSISGALVGICLWIEAITNLMSEFADSARFTSQGIAALSDEEYQALKDINDVIARGPGSFDTDGKWIVDEETKKDPAKFSNWTTQLQNMYNEKQLKYNNFITQTQTRLEAKQGFVSDASKQTTGDYTNLNSLCQIFANLATLLK